MIVSLRRKSFSQLVFSLSLLIAFPAYAHVGAGAVDGFAHGVQHPLLGADHLCAMLAVGLWASQSGGRSLWLVPLTFVGVMALGGLSGMAAMPLPFVEGGILMSLLVLGVLVAAAVRLPLAASVALVDLFALFHGHAHGAEMPHDASGLRYALGFMLSTAVLHLAGIAIASALGHIGRPQWLRLIGASVAAFGGALFFIG